jgi:hypothetical protein
MATIEHNTDSASCVPTRREFLGQAVPLAAATAAGVGALPAMAAIELPTGTDPHVAWWRERQELQAAIKTAYGEKREDDLVRQQYELDERIVGTAPTTPEGDAIVAALLLDWYKADSECTEIDQDAGATLARRYLAGLPADVKRRAGLEAVGTTGTA